MFKHIIESYSKIGGRSENQDYYQILESKFGLVAVVCDGMGGTKGGRLAAELAVNSILDEITASTETNPKDAIVAAISKANSVIRQQRNNNYDLRGMGTTVAVLQLNGNAAICFHVGDSRIYHLRDNTILYRTFDHSRVFEMVSLGILTEEEARVSSESNIINKALGISDEVEISISEKLPYRKGDRFLVCTDGIWGAVPESQLVRMISGKSPIEEVAQRLVEDIDQIGTENGGKYDNLTAVLIEVQNDTILTIKKTLNLISNKWLILVIAICAILFTIISHLLAFKE